ncbi:MAG TPA: 30S ribosomal protein S8 [Candidatus Saccharimonadales bacterium]|nr:30S ribosomal protein S8 [Candidatus Saccharimonadales bacterium]
MNPSTQTSTDPIADMLTRIRNAIAVNSAQVRLPHSKIKQTIAKILADNGFIAKVEAEGDGVSKQLVITINNDDEPTRITAISRLSRPGRRVYVKAGAVPTVRRGRGLVVVSTSSGIMTGAEAKAKKLGGELICEVY